MSIIHVFVALFGVRLILSVLVAWAARTYGRPAGAWFLLALLVSPVIAFAVLWIVGSPADGALGEKEERLRQRHPDRTDIREVAMNEMRCPRCGAALNVVTG